MLMTMMMVQESNAISPIAFEVAKRFARQHGDGPLSILDLGYDINVQPFSLITVRDRPLSPAAMTLYEHIVREVERQNL